MGEKLRDAISAIQLHAASGLRMNEFEAELRLVCRAARALACPKCKGRGGWPNWKKHDEWECCDECRSDRKEIEIYG